MIQEDVQILQGQTLPLPYEGTSLKWCLSSSTSRAVSSRLTAHCVASASSAFARLRRVEAWSSKALSSSTKVQFFQSIVMLVLLYGVETWTVLNRHLGPLSVF